MSLLMVTQWEDWVELVSDTLVVRGDHDVPVGYYPKVFPIPHLNMVMAATGTAEVAAAWFEFVKAANVRDVEDINELATDKLREIQAEVAELHGDAETSTIYHFGFPVKSDAAVAYTYTSMNGRSFESDRFQGNKFMVKPGPKTFACEPQYAPEEKIALAYRIREEQQQFRDDGKEWVPIGGELWATCLEKDNIRSQLWHRFPGYDESLPSYV